MISTRSASTWIFCASPPQPNIFMAMTEWPDSTAAHMQPTTNWNMPCDSSNPFTRFMPKIPAAQLADPIDTA